MLLHIHAGENQQKTTTKQTGGCGRDVPETLLQVRRYVLWYTLLYAILFGVILYYFRDSSRSLVYHADAWRQHLRAYAYYGKWLRGYVWNILRNHTLSPQTWSFGLGYGADVLTTLQYYCLGEPLAVFTVFVPEGYTKYYFEFLIILRPYLAGLSFSAYARYAVRQIRIAGRTKGQTNQLYVRLTKGRTFPLPGRLMGEALPSGDKRSTDTSAVLAGAICYAFCGTVLYLGMLHPFFVTPMIYLPLLLFGVERILQEKRPAVFMVSVWLAGVTNFYFFYVLALLTAGYGVFRVIARGRGVRNMVRQLLQLLGCALAGTLAAGAVLLPVLIQFSSNPRSETTFQLSLFYEPAYYRELLRNLVTFINHPDYDTELGMSALCAAALVLLMVRKGHRQLKSAVIVCVLMLCFPAAGYVMNGFSYVINRWSFGAEFLLAFVLVVIWRELLQRRAAAAAGLFLVMLTIGLNICTGYADHYDSKTQTVQEGFPSEFIDAQTPKEYQTASCANETLAVSTYADAAGEQDFFRYTGRDLTYNAGAQKGLPSTQFFWSLTGDAVSDFFQALGVYEEQNFCYTGLDDRTILEELAGVRYYTIAYDNETERQYVPFGFEDVGTVPVYETKETALTGNGIEGELGGVYGDDSWESWHDSYHLYRSAFALPLGYTYTEVMSCDQFDALSLTKRQEALVQGVVLENGSYQELCETTEERDEDAERKAGASQDKNDSDRIALETVNPSFYESVLPYTIEVSEGARAMQNGTGYSFLAERSGAQVTLRFDSTANAELYLVLQDLEVSPIGENALQELYNLQVTTSRQGVDGIGKIIHYKTPVNQYYSGWRNFALNLGYRTETADSITITGAITAEQDRYLVFSIPYSSGWQVYDNGKRASVQKANIMYMGIPICAGKHEITLVYQTPGARTGRWLSIIGAAGMLGILWSSRRKQKWKQ